MTNTDNPLCGFCNYPLVELDQPRCPRCGSKYDLTDTNTFNATGIPISVIDRYLIAAPPWPVIIIGMAIIACGLWVLREPQYAMQAPWIFGWYLGICPMVIGLRFVQLMLRLAVRHKHGRATYLKRLRSKYPAWPFLAAIIISSSWAAERRMPMYWAFNISQDAMNRLADQALAGPKGFKMLTPARTGLYVIQSIVVYDDGHIFLYTDSDDIWGYARLPGFGMDMGDYEEYLFKKDNPCEEYDLSKQTLFGKVVCRIQGEWYIVYSLHYYQKLGWS